MIVAPSTHIDSAHSAATGGKERRMPVEQPFFGKTLIEVSRRVEHDFDNAFDVPVGWYEARDIHAEAPGDRGPNLNWVELFPFDLTSLENVLGEGLQGRFLAQPKPKGSHLAEQNPLIMPGLA
jgi:hypothetical protein